MVYLSVKAESKNLPGKNSINIMYDLIFMPIKTVSAMLPIDHLHENLIQNKTYRKKNLQVMVFAISMVFRFAVGHELSAIAR